MFGRGMTGAIDIRIGKDRAGGVRPFTPDGEDLGTITLASDPETGAVEVTFTARAGSGGSNTIESAQALVRLRHETFDVIEHDPGIGSKDLRDSVGGDTTAGNQARKWLIDEGYVQVEKVGRVMTHHTLKAFPAV